MPGHGEGEKLVLGQFLDSSRSLGMTRKGCVGARGGACLISPLNTAGLDILDQCDGCRKHKAKS